MTPDLKERRSSPTLGENDRKLYFGNETVYLKPVKGEVFGVPGLNEERSPKSMELLTQSAIHRQHPIRLNDGKLFAQPSIPATDLPSILNNLSNDRKSTQILLKPFLKCNQKESRSLSGSLVAVASGKRSAIMFAKEKSFRLKGCGNLDQGFLLEEKGDHGELSLRGCMFEQTVQRELYMTQRVGRAIVDTGIRHIQCANTSLGLSQYTDKECLGFEIQYPGLPTPYCGIFETVGDRRLGDHLLAGIEAMLPLLYADSHHQVSEAWVKQATARIEKIRGNLWDTATRAECGMEAFDLTLIGFREQPISLKDFSCLSLGIPKEYRNLWESTYEELCDVLTKLSETMECPNVVLWLARAIGEECGLVCHAMKRHGISWGTYPDATGIHCNSHANNMVVRACRQQGDSFLCPLDFDMAYHISEFLPTIVQSQRQKVFPSKFEDIVSWEQSMGMRTSLAGSDFTSTGVTNIDSNSYYKNEGENEIKQKFLSIFSIAFRDTMVRAFDDTLRDGVVHINRKEYESSVAVAADLIIKLALICTCTKVC
mmetsp:Transcript_14522/g.19071  ORF Transcript_14522/g.19071 Transcript_14522/m.19071 type:complete len:541 (-) Transcript_14522:1239-2861(-)